VSLVSTPRAFAAVGSEILGASLRRVTLCLSRMRGTAARINSHGWGPAIKWLTVVAIGLLVLPPAINGVFSLLGDVGLWDSLELGSNPTVGTQWTAERVLGIVAGVLVVRWFLRARDRVVIEEFVDYT